MAQLTIYIPDDIAEKAREMAKNANKSFSGFVGELVAREITPEAWPQDLLDLLGSGHGDLVEPDDPPPEDVEAL
jgi:predicted transcriptional regulator